MNVHVANNEVDVSISHAQATIYCEEAFNHAVLTKARIRRAFYGKFLLNLSRVFRPECS